MTDNDIIKALECCGSAKVCCRDCPLYDDAKDIICQDELVVEVYKLFNRQQTEDYKEEIKSEAVREFAEKLKEHCNEITNQEWNKKTSPVSWVDAYEAFIDDIDRLVEEMRCNNG